MARDSRLCQPCLRKKPQRITAATEVDHIVPKAKGGTDELTNLQAICGECHKDKTIKDSGGKPKPVIGLDGWAL
jgi:5-methylcytosine-specific restriction protein A